MGGLVSGLFDLFSGNPAQKEQDQFGALGDYQTSTGEGLTTAGAKYDEDILSGDPTRIAQSLAPEISAQQGQIEQNKLQDANFGTRSGGTTASNENADAAGRANIINLVGATQKGAADSALSAGSGLLGQASSNVGNEANLAEQRRSQVNSDIGGIATSAAEIASGFGGGAPAASPASAAGADPLGEATGGFTPFTGMDPLGANPGPDLSVFQNPGIQGDASI